MLMGFINQFVTVGDHIVDLPEMNFTHMLHGVRMLIKIPAPWWLHVHTAYMVVPHSCHSLISNSCN